MTQLPLRQKSLSGVKNLQLRKRCRAIASVHSFNSPDLFVSPLPANTYVAKLYKHVAQVGRGTVSLADAFAHSYQESKVPLVTPAGNHVGEVEIFFVFASKEVDLM